MDGIIFDVDGTLWDSTDVVAKAWNQVIQKETGRPSGITGALLKTLFGKPMNEICLTIFQGIPISEHERLAALCYEAENALLYKETVSLFPQVAEVCPQLAKEHPLFIVSNCQKGYIEALLDTTPLKDYIQGHLCYGDTNASKDITIRTLMKQYHLKDAIYVGDTQGDADACKKAGVPFVFAAYGFGSVASADYHIQSFSDLLSISRKHQSNPIT